MKKTTRMIFCTGLLAASILLLCSIEAMAWKVWQATPDIILVVDLPEDDSVVCTEADVACSAIATDEDEWRWLGDTVWYREADEPISYTWSATGGTFPSGNTGQSVIWKAPTTPGTYTITCTADDPSGCHVDPPDYGCRNDDAEQQSVDVQVKSIAECSVIDKNAIESSGLFDYNTGPSQLAERWLTWNNSGDPQVDPWAIYCKDMVNGEDHTPDRRNPTNWNYHSQKVCLENLETGDYVMSFDGAVKTDSAADQEDPPQLSRNDSVTAKVYIKTVNMQNVKYCARVVFSNSGGQTISAINVIGEWPNVWNTTGTSGSWTKYSNTGTVPENAATWGIQIRFARTSESPSGAIYVDDVSITNGETISIPVTPPVDRLKAFNVHGSYKDTQLAAERWDLAVTVSGVAASGTRWHNPTKYTLEWYRPSVVTMVMRDGMSGPDGLDPEYYLYEKVSEQYSKVHHGGSWYANIGNTDYQDWWIDNAIGDVESSADNSEPEYDGVFMDCPSSSWRISYFHNSEAYKYEDGQYSMYPVYINCGSSCQNCPWNADYATFVGLVHNDNDLQGKPLCLNYGGNSSGAPDWDEDRTDNCPHKNYLPNIDCVYNENTFMLYDSYWAVDPWKTQIDQMHECRVGGTYGGEYGKYYLCSVPLDPHDDDYVSRRRYALGSYMLGMNDYTMFSLYSCHEGESNRAVYTKDIETRTVVDEVKYGGAYDLGSPSGAYSKHPNLNVYQRQFSNGYVVVNPQTYSSQFQLYRALKDAFDDTAYRPGAYYTGTPNGISAHRALILKNDDDVLWSAVTNLHFGDSFPFGPVTISGSAHAPTGKTLDYIEVFVDGVKDGNATGTTSWTYEWTPPEGDETYAIHSNAVCTDDTEEDDLYTNRDVLVDIDAE